MKRSFLLIPLIASSLQCAGESLPQPVGGAGAVQAGAGGAASGGVPPAAGASVAGMSVAGTASAGAPAAGAAAAGTPATGGASTAGALAGGGAVGMAGTSLGGGGAVSVSGGAAGVSGGGASTAGSSGSVGGNGGGGASGSGQCKGGLLCDDFEAYADMAVPTGPWEVTTQGAGTAKVVTTRAFSGTKSVHFRGTVNADAVYMLAQRAPVFPVAGNALFVRFMMYVGRWPNASPMHTRLVWVGSRAALRSADGSGYAMETYNGIAIERLGSGRFRDTSQRMTDAANTGKWICWEFEINNTAGPPPGASGSVLPRMWRDGTSMQLAIAGSSVTWNPAPFELLQFSLFAYQADTGVADYWIDDVVMNTSRIGCPTAP